MIYLFYSNKEIFLCELVLNVFDVVDKLCFEGFVDNVLYENDLNLCICIGYDKVVCMIMIDDNGIGMSCDEVIVNFGMIVWLGIKEFFMKLLGD